MTKIKQKIINVIPQTSIAKHRFATIMNSYHACKVFEEKDNMYYLISLNGLYHFHCPIEGNQHWRIVK